MNWFTKNVLLFNLVVLVAAVAWIHGGMRADLLLPVIPWLAVIVLEWLLVYPQTKKNESLLDARRRVWRALARDPLTYLSVVFTVVLVIPLFNVASAPQFVAETGEWVKAEPPVGWLPFCADTSAHSPLLLWFIPAMIAVLAAKHGLLKKSKRILLEAACWNGTVLAVLGFLQLWSGTTAIFWMTKVPVYFFSSFGYPNSAGAYFTLTFALSFGIWLQQMTEGSVLFAETTQEMLVLPSKFRSNRMLVPTILCLAAAIASLSRAAILLCALLAVVFLVYGLVYVWRRLTVAMRITVLAGIGAVLFSSTALFFAFNPASLKKEVSSITWDAVTERVSGVGQYHVRVATEIWKDHPVYGVGGWGYLRYQLVYLTPEEKKKLQIFGGANVHNDTFQFLAEQGAVGFGLMVLFALTLFGTMAWGVLKACRARRKVERAKGKKMLTGWVSLIPPPAMAVWAGTTATVCHSLGDLPFRCPAVLVVWLLAFVCATGWIPVVVKSK